MDCFLIGKINDSPGDTECCLDLLCFIQNRNGNTPDVLFVFGIVDCIPASSHGIKLFKQAIYGGDSMRRISLKTLNLDYVFKRFSR